MVTTVLALASLSHHSFVLQPRGCCIKSNKKHRILATCNGIHIQFVVIDRPILETIMRTDITNPTWVLSLGVQQGTHESQEPSVSG